MKLEDQREETPFAVRDNALDMRREITELGFRRYGKKARTFPKFPSNWGIWSPESQAKWKQTQQTKLEQAEQFDEWFIQNERTVLDEILRNIIFKIDQANSINPQYLFECDDQRRLQDEVIGLCNNLIRELNYIGDTIPANKNFIARQTDIINKELALVRGWRKSCNETRAKVLEMEIKRRKTATERMNFISMQEL